MKITKQSTALYQKAIEELSLINQAWQRPKIDDLAFIFCQSVKECMHDLLSCFLLMKNGEFKSNDNLGNLVTQCAAIDDRFREIDLRWINCKEMNRNEDGTVFCSTPEQIKICIWIANGIRKLIDEDISKATTKDLVSENK